MRVGSFHVIPAAVAGGAAGAGGGGAGTSAGVPHNPPAGSTAAQQAQAQAQAAQAQQPHGLSPYHASQVQIAVQQQQQQQAALQAYLNAYAAQQQMPHNLIPGAAALHAAALAQQAQMAAVQAQQAANAALAAGHGHGHVMMTADRRGSSLAAGAGTGTRVSPVPPSFYGPAPPALPPSRPATWIASQHPPNPAPPNVPGLPLYGLPVNPATGTPFQTLQDMAAALGPACPPPTFNGINLNYPGVRMLSDPDATGAGAGAGAGGSAAPVPPVYAVDNFLTPDECDFLIAAAGNSFTPAPVVGSGAGEVSASRTSSTVYLAREDLPLYLEKVCRLVGRPRDHCELPQVGRYFPSQQYLQHFDAFDLGNEDGQRFASNGGQRVVTVLVYLNDVEKGGSTSFPALGLDVRPRKGMAVVFFPATVDGLLDKNALHAACPAVDTKYVSQVWIRQGPYSGLPSKRIFPNEEVARRAAMSFRSAPGVATGGAMPIEGLLTGAGGVAGFGGGGGGGDAISGVTSAATSAAASLSPSAHSSAPTSGNGAGLAPSP